MSLSLSFCMFESTQLSLSLVPCGNFMDASRRSTQEPSRTDSSLLSCDSTQTFTEAWTRLGLLNVVGWLDRGTAGVDKALHRVVSQVQVSSKSSSLERRLSLHRVWRRLHSCWHQNWGVLIPIGRRQCVQELVLILKPRRHQRGQIGQAMGSVWMGFQGQVGE